MEKRKKRIHLFPRGRALKILWFVNLLAAIAFLALLTVVNAFPAKLTMYILVVFFALLIISQILITIRSRNKLPRIIGVLLYVYKVDGFLHWGYNFWNSGLSRRFCQVLGSEVDWDYNSGDGYLVYPGSEGPLSSQRYEVFYQELQDLRALETLETALGREEVLTMINQLAGMQIKMDKFPLNNEFPEQLRREINRRLAGCDTKKA